jgi:hypothetical protein
MLIDKPKNETRLESDVHAGADVIRQELERILESKAFKATGRRRKLLRYLVEELLAGRTRELKGYSIATLVFDRDDSFDPQTDPVVRLEARRLRHDLDGYYATDGRDNPLRINIPKGQYVPAIEWAEPSIDDTVASSPPPATGITSAEPVEPAVDTGIGSKSRLHQRATIAAIVALSLMVFLMAYALLALETPRTFCLPPAWPMKSWPASAVLAACGFTCLPARTSNCPVMIRSRPARTSIFRMS